MALQDIIDSLTEQQKQKLENCKSKDEMTDLLLAEDIELTDELLESVAGGDISEFFCTRNAPSYF